MICSQTIFPFQTLPRQLTDHNRVKITRYLSYYRLMITNPMRMSNFSSWHAYAKLASKIPYNPNRISPISLLIFPLLLSCCCAVVLLCVVFLCCCAVVLCCRTVVLSYCCALVFFCCCVLCCCAVMFLCCFAVVLCSFAVVLCSCAVVLLHCTCKWRLDCSRRPQRSVQYNSA